MKPQHFMKWSTTVCTFVRKTIGEVMKDASEEEGIYFLGQVTYNQDESTTQTSSLEVCSGIPMGRRTFGFVWILLLWLDSCCAAFLSRNFMDRFSFPPWNISSWKIEIQLHGTERKNKEMKPKTMPLTKEAAEGKQGIGLPEHTEPNAIPIETHSSCCQVSPSTAGTSSCSRAINDVQLMALLFWLAEMVSLNSSSLVTMAIELEFNYLLERSPDSCGVGFSTWMLLGSQEKHQGLVRTAMF
ncbi:hypothetical protein Q9233_006779 [Columba guinea]|nr:hypothetical protein Q9233_006779 [Columba guinea]